METLVWKNLTAVLFFPVLIWFTLWLGEHNCGVKNGPEFHMNSNSGEGWSDD